MSVKKFYGQKFTSGAGAVSANQAYQWSLQHSWHLADPVCWQTQGGQHRAIHPTSKAFLLLMTSLKAICITLFLYPVRQRNSVQIPDYTIEDIITSRHWSHTCRYSPHPTYDEAHLLPPQHDLYHCYPLQRWDPEYSGSSVATMAGSVTSQEIK